MNKKEHVSNMIALIMKFNNDNVIITYKYQSNIKSFSVAAYKGDDILYSGDLYMDDLSTIKDFEAMKNRLEKIINEA